MLPPSIGLSTFHSYIQRLIANSLYRQSISTAIKTLLLSTRIMCKCKRKLIKELKGRTGVTVFMVHIGLQQFTN